jgi:hypothetical protein
MKIMCSGFHKYLFRFVSWALVERGHTSGKELCPIIKKQRPLDKKEKKGKKKGRRCALLCNSVVHTATHAQKRVTL